MPEHKCTDEDILKFISSYHKKYGWAPTVREIAEGVGLFSSNSVHQRLLRLKQQNKIIYEGVRRIRVVQK